MAGYSGTPLAKKLGIKPGTRVAFASPPAGFEDLLDELPPGVRTRGPVRGPLDVIVCFARTRSELAGRLPALRRAMDPAAGLWIAWPKRSSGEATDLSEDVVRELADENTLVDNKVCAIDDVWSALRLVIRLRDR